MTAQITFVLRSTKVLDLATQGDQGLIEAHKVIKDQEETRAISRGVRRFTSTATDNTAYTKTSMFKHGNDVRHRKAKKVKMTQHVLDKVDPKDGRSLGRILQVENKTSKVGSASHTKHIWSQKFIPHLDNILKDQDKTTPFHHQER